MVLQIVCRLSRGGLMALTFLGLILGLKVPTAAESRSPTSVSMAAAEGLLDAWGPDLVAEATYELGSARQTEWSNLPANLLRTPRPGVRLGDLGKEDRQAVFTFLETVLSPSGFAVVSGVVQADDVLSHHPRAERFGWTSDNYWFALFGMPSDSQPWAWQFGGHHLAVHVTVVDGQQRLSPLFLGVEPAAFERSGQTVRPMAEMVEQGLALVSSLSPEHLEAARVQRRPREVYAGPGKDGEIPPLEGIAVAGWASEQQDGLLQLIRLWIGLLPESSSDARMAEIQLELATMHVAWHGAVDGSTPIYLRIQSRGLLIELSTESAVGAEEASGHYHSVVRDLKNDYGAVSIGMSEVGH